MKKTLVALALLSISGCATVEPGYAGSQSGIASIFCDRHTASGVHMDCSAMVAAHKSIPFGTHVTVHNGNHSIVVTIIDRGPYVHGRIIDLSPGAGRALGCPGLCKVELEW